MEIPNGRKKLENSNFPGLIFVSVLFSTQSTDPEKSCTHQEKNLSEKVTGSESTKDEKEDLDLKTIDIEKVREEKVDPGNKPSGKVNKSTLITENPFMNFIGLTPVPYSQKSSSTVSRKNKLKSFAKVSAGVYATFDLQAGIVLPELNNFETGLKLISTEGHIINAGYKRGLATLILPFTSDNDMGISIKGKYAENFNNDNNSIIKKDWNAGADLYHDWYLETIINQSTLFGSFYSLDDIENKYFRKEALMGISNRSAWEYSMNLRLYSDLWIAMHNLDYLNQTVNDIQIDFAIGGSYSVIENTSIDMGFNIFRFNWAVSDSINLQNLPELL